MGRVVHVEHFDQVAAATRSFQVDQLGAAAVIVTLQATPQGNVTFQENFTTGQFLEAVKIVPIAVANGTLTRFALALSGSTLQFITAGAGTFTGHLTFVDVPMQGGIIPIGEVTGSIGAAGTATIFNNFWGGYAVQETFLAVNSNRAMTLRQSSGSRNVSVNDVEKSLATATGGGLITDWIPSLYTSSQSLRNDDAVQILGYTAILWGRLASFG